MPRSDMFHMVWCWAIYFVLFMYGLFVGHDHDANFVPLNDADNRLHLILSVAMMAMAIAARRELAAHR